MQPLDEHEGDQAVHEHAGAPDQHALSVRNGAAGPFPNDGHGEARKRDRWSCREEAGKALGVARLANE
jgi:hypothetical protein